jgi:hypothetical protein
MTTTSHEELHADAFPIGRRLMYLDRDDGGPDKVTVRVGVVAGACRTEPDSALLIPVTDPNANTDSPRLIAAADVLGSGSRSGNQHEANQPPRWRHHLSPMGRHHRRDSSAE